MVTAELHPDPVAAFNSRLAHAKIHALQLLLDLTASITDPNAAIGDEIRELRLAATAILRTQPMKLPPPPRASPPPPPEPPRASTHAPGTQDSTTQDSAPQDSAPELSPPVPTYRSNLNPTCRSARADIRRLIREGIPEIIDLFPHGLPPFDPQALCTSHPSPPASTRAPPPSYQGPPSSLNSSRHQTQPKAGRGER